MCKYCDIKKTKENYGRAETYICDSRYECCHIVYEDGIYYIRIVGSDESFSDRISFCPFCGRKLND